MRPIVSAIRIYPIKSLDGIAVQSAEIGNRSLLHDREFAMLADDGRFINGKRTGRVNQLMATYDLPSYTVKFTERGSGIQDSFHLTEDKRAIETYLSDFFKMPVIFLHNTEGRLLDIPDISSLTILSTASLTYLSQQIKGHDVEDMRLRFRANIEITGVPEFWEERLAGDSGEGVNYRIGNVNLAGNSLRARCNVPPKDPFTGELDKTFVNKMITAREKNIPEWSMIRQLSSLYHLSVDCSLPDTETGKCINIGDEVEII